MDMMLLERRGNSGAIDDPGTVDVIEMVSSDITVVFNVVCDAKYAENVIINELSWHNIFRI